jgi:hypothetical protein
MLGFLVCALPARAAEQGRIAVFHDDVTVRLFLQMPILPLGIKANKIDNETEAQEELRDDAEHSYLPNLRLNAGAAVYYKGFGGSFSQQVVTISDTDKRGITKCTDYRFHEYYRKFGADLVYLNYDGFI